MFIYLIVNHKTGKYYVGQHKGSSLKRYLQQKFSHARTGVSECSRLFRSMRKHPDPSAWSIHALRSDIQTKPELDETEQDFIKFLKAQDSEYGYNICRGGEGFTGPVSLETRVRMSKTHKLMWSDRRYRTETTAKLVKAKKQKWDAHPELRVIAGAKMREGLKKGWADPNWRHEQIEKMRHRKRGHHLSGSHKLAISKGLRGNPKLYSKERRLRADKGRHTRWHVSRGIKELKCIFCSTE